MDIKLKITAHLICLILTLVKPGDIRAEAGVVTASAKLDYGYVEKNVDHRITNLKNYLESMNSPIVEYAEVFVNQADKYNLDYRLVASISGVESTFGKRMPKNSYNAYGWAGGKYRFSSWEESISHVSRTLDTKYYQNGADNVNKIARRYAPPSTTWSRNVMFFMNKIDPVPANFDF